MERTGRGRYETSLDDPEFTVMDDEAGPDGCFMLNIFADRRGFFPTLLDQPAQENPAVEPHIMLSRVWNALASSSG